MAEGQKKSNRGAKQPKAAKPTAADKVAAAHAFLSKPTTGKSGK